jgi:putative flippase GtrA
MTETPTLEADDTNRVKESRQFLSFAITGGLAAICNVGSRMLLSRVMR